MYGVKNEDYSKSRTLAAVEYMDEKFCVVRDRIHGKTWRKYLCLTHGGIKVANGFGAAAALTDPKEFAAWCLERMVKTWPRCLDSDKAAFLASLEEIKSKNRPEAAT